MAKLEFGEKEVILAKVDWWVSHFPLKGGT
jgi:hypothetical protein